MRFWGNSSAYEHSGHERDIGAQQQYGEFRNQTGDNALGDFLNLDVADTAGHVQVDAHGRREQPDGEVHNHDDA